MSRTKKMRVDVPDLVHENLKWVQAKIYDEHPEIVEPPGCPVCGHVEPVLSLCSDIRVTFDPPELEQKARALVERLMSRPTKCHKCGWYTLTGARVFQWTLGEVIGLALERLVRSLRKEKE